MTRFRAVVGLALCCLATLTPAADPPTHDTRPCGPDSLKGPIRHLIPQGFGRTDFRPSCQTHDNCYSNPHATKAECDAEFRDRMFVACDRSRFPAACRTQARVMSASVRLLGDGAFRAAQANSSGTRFSGPNSP